MGANEERSESDLQVLILDYGSQYTHLITRRIRSLSVHSLCISGTSPLSAITALSPRVIILSGGPNSVHSPDAPSFPDGFIDYVRSSGVFVLGICYGLQLLVQSLGGVVAGEKHEYGHMEIQVDKASTGGLFGNKCVGDKQSVWMSHAEGAVTLPDGFEVVARSHKGAIAAVEDRRRRFYGFQYHPEVTHSPQGMDTLRYFLFDICGVVSADRKMEDVMEEELKAIQSTVGPDDHVICALSGGVDSTVAATLVHKAIGDRLHCVFVNNGLLRHNEQARVIDTFRKDLDLPVTCIDATERFLRELRGKKDGEEKRKIIGDEFIKVFDEFALHLEKKLGRKPVYLVQGTLYTDVIESCPAPGSGRSHSHTIKSHHNVGGLPKNMKLKLIEPFRRLFKDEVRAIGKVLSVPESFLKRHPFPGPGLAVRIIGDVTKGNRLEIVRQADEIFVEAIKEAGLYDSIWQAFVVLIPICTVGVQGDQRTEGHVVVMRAVTSEDGMTADWYPFKQEFIDDVTQKIINNVRGVVHVCLDTTTKPPSTIEWV